ncbi:MAG: hypothetical protein ROO76_09655 [Terriglobia bacterium]|jgi:hypothetical protein|nr:hypothetical protein [Terriglobia bacterium]
MDFELDRQDEGWAKEFREACRAEAERPTVFWAAQRANVRAKVAARHRFSSLRLALASTAALLIVAGAMLTSGSSPVVTPVPQTARTHNISDQQLLADIDETLADPTPDALAPMELISQDMDRSLQAQSSKQTR